MSTHRLLLDLPQPSQPTLNQSGPLPSRNLLQNIIAVSQTYPPTIYIPIYVRASMKELINVNLKEKKVTAAFKIEIYVFINIDQDSVRTLHSQDNEEYYEQLNHFLQNNLALQIGGTFVDIAHQSTNSPYKPSAQAVPLRQTQQKSREEGGCRRPKRLGQMIRHDHLFISFQEEMLLMQDGEGGQSEEQSFEQNYFARKSFVAGSSCVTHVVMGTFDCDFQLDSTFFPYHEIHSSLKVLVLHQYFRDVIIKYNLFFSEGRVDRHQQFNHLFTNLNFARFGKYSVDLDSFRTHSESLPDVSLEEISKNCYPKITGMGFEFRVFSFNVPFMLRQEIPLWTLCLAALVLFFNNPKQVAFVYIDNVLLLSISFIFLLTNFRMGMYCSNGISLYELTIASFIITNFLQVLYTINSPHSGEAVNSFHGGWFYAAVVATSLLFLSNLVVLAVLGLKSRQQFGEFPKKGESALRWIEEIEELVGNSQADLHARIQYIKLSND